MIINSIAPVVPMSIKFEDEWRFVLAITYAHTESSDSKYASDYVTYETTTGSVFQEDIEEFKFLMTVPVHNLQWITYEEFV
jgi:hypothetical protein